MITPEKIKETINQYFQAIQEKDKTTWLNLFAKDGISYDPVNSPPLDTESKRSAFFDGIINSISHLSIALDEIFVVDDEAAVQWKMQATGKNNKVVTFTGIDIFEIDAHAKVKTLKTYWDPSGMGTLTE
ncbi:MAG: nuclear transport factor 2 family protein [Spirochaetota bacterium]